MNKNRLVLGFLLILLVVTVTCRFWAKPFSAQIARRCGPALVRAGDGKFSDPAIFLQHRFTESAELLTLAIGLVAASVGVGALLARRTIRLWKWTAYSALGFVSANIWLKFATSTCLFWCLFWNGKGATDNLTQFHIKLLLMDENPAPVKVVLAGSSQVRTQIDARLLNDQLGANIFTTELHFPGNHAFDFLFLNRELTSHKADIAVCYLSEQSFFSGAVSEGFPFFFGFRDWPEFIRLGGKARWAPRSLGYGLLAQALPLFWLRDPLAQRVLGEPLVTLQQNARDTGLSSDLEHRAAVAAKAYRADAQSKFCFAAFQAYVAQCRSIGRKVVICSGQVNPILSRQLDPTLRKQMLEFLNNVAAKYDNVVLLQDKQLPAQNETDYDDLMHVNAAARIRFTQTLGRVLANPNGLHASAGN